MQLVSLGVARPTGPWPRAHVFAIAIASLLLAVPTRAASGAPTVEEAWLSGDLDSDDLAVLPLSGSYASSSPGRASTSVSLVGFTRTATTGAEETGAFLVVGLPLDKLARTKVLPRLASDTRPELRLARDDGEDGQDEREDRRPVPIALRDETVVLTPSLVRMCLARALRAAGLHESDAALDAIVSRARWSAALPEVRLRAVQFDDERLYTDVTTQTSASRLRDQAGAQVSLEARLTWRLDHLLYADDEPSFERIKQDHREARSRVERQVLDGLFKWQRAWAELGLAEHDGAARSTAEALDLALRVTETEATLDVLTAGWFSAWRARSLAVLVSKKEGQRGRARELEPAEAARPVPPATGSIAIDEASRDSPPPTSPPANAHEAGSVAKGGKGDKGDALDGTSDATTRRQALRAPKVRRADL